MKQIHESITLLKTSDKEKDQLMKNMVQHTEEQTQAAADFRLDTVQVRGQQKSCV